MVAARPEVVDGTADARAGCLGMDDIRHDRDDPPLASWIAGIAAIAVAAGIALLAAAGSVDSEMVLWLDGAIVISALVGLLAWIVASISR